MADKNDILKEVAVAYRAAAAQVVQTGKPVLLARQEEIAVVAFPWETFRAFEKWYEEQERERWWREQHEAFEREVAAFERMKDDLLEKHRGQYVAIYKGEIVGVGSDKMDLTRQMYEQFGHVTMLVHLVTKNEPIYHIPSFRVVDGGE